VHPIRSLGHQPLRDKRLQAWSRGFFPATATPQFASEHEARTVTPSWRALNPSHGLQLSAGGSSDRTAGECWQALGDRLHVKIQSRTSMAYPDETHVPLGRNLEQTSTHRCPLRYRATACSFSSSCAAHTRTPSTGTLTAPTRPSLVSAGQGLPQRSTGS
jgi:hypothetical protein